MRYNTDLIPDRLRQLCYEKRVSLRQVAKDTNISYDVLIKTSHGRLPNTKTLLALSDYFNVSVDFILGAIKYEM